MATAGRALALQAARAVRLPVGSIETNPRATSLVGLPTWFWIDSSSWHAFSATATAGTLAATATATPVSLVFEAGDGTVVTCRGPGTAYRLDLPAAGQTTSCSHVYRASSAGQPAPDGEPDHAAYPISATITWSVSWVASDGTRGSLPSLTTTARGSLRVAQAQSVDRVP